MLKKERGGREKKCSQARDTKKVFVLCLLLRVRQGRAEEEEEEKQKSTDKCVCVSLARLGTVFSSRALPFRLMRWQELGGVCERKWSGQKGYRSFHSAVIITCLRIAVRLQKEKNK